LQRKPSTNFSTIILDILKHNQNIEGCSQAKQPYSDSSLKTLQKAKDYCREELRSCLSLLPQAPDCAPDSDCTGSAANTNKRIITFAKMYACYRREKGQIMGLIETMRVRKAVLHGVSTTSLDLPAVLASPDSNCFPLHSKLVGEQRREALGQNSIICIYILNIKCSMLKHLPKHSNMVPNKQNWQ
jgi:hypothetical protein